MFKVNPELSRFHVFSGLSVLPRFSRLQCSKGSTSSQFSSVPIVQFSPNVSIVSGVCNASNAPKIPNVSQVPSVPSFPAFPVLQVAQCLQTLQAIPVLPVFPGSPLSARHAVQIPAGAEGSQMFFPPLEPRRCSVNRSEAAGSCTPYTCT